MEIRGITKFTLLDYPGKLACIVFVGGCNFRCPYCHNPSLVFDPEAHPLLTEDEFLAFLESRRGKLEAVVVSGGEPTLCHDLKDFLAKVKALGFAVKLDTNGSRPEVVAALLTAKAIDFLAIDYKAPAARYPNVAGIDSPDVGAKVGESLRLGVEAGVTLEVRSTVHKALLGPDDLAAMRRELDQLGVTDWVLQQFNPAEIIDDQLLTLPNYSDQELRTLAASFHHTRVRGLKGNSLQASPPKGA